MVAVPATVQAILAARIDRLADRNPNHRRSHQRGAETSWARDAVVGAVAPCRGSRWRGRSASGATGRRPCAGHKLHRRIGRLAQRRGLSSVGDATPCKVWLDCDWMNPPTGISPPSPAGATDREHHARCERRSPSAASGKRASFTTEARQRFLRSMGSFVARGAPLRAARLGSGPGAQ